MVPPPRTLPREQPFRRPPLWVPIYLHARTQSPQKSPQFLVVGDGPSMLLFSEPTPKKSGWVHMAGGTAGGYNGLTGRRSSEGPLPYDWGSRQETKDHAAQPNGALREIEEETAKRTTFYPVV